ncbi:PA2169 family four-helix-bundle protein [Tenacibaculum sp. IB213877]|uniref:ferritin-like domain-containing protein n=1 Tax=Tenacibaculum sp. IB213877 TaxID=3097351 RepID=UPI002A59F031|nr:PA2169 family four-helix-bundle protein [Tenacibaculum sp. IB213877]MDY0779522.1 PA2169 family four-helix-bundle protein [Tenacibaculum sp. IB213877]
MYSYTEAVSNQLNGLLEKNYDAEKGYRTASENAKGNALTQFFEKKARERRNFADQLKTEIRTFGKTPDEGGSIKGAAHRAWMNTKALFSSDNDEVMLEEAIRGEKASIEEYNEVINSDEHLPQSTANLLKNQRDQIISDTVLIHKLEDIKS